jgi:hypothetical protein
MSSVRRAPLNLAELVPALPAVTLPNGIEVQMAPLTARGYELFLAIQRAMGGEGDIDFAFVEKLDEVLAIVLPTATPDDLASLGVRHDLKLAVILSAAGAVDSALDAIKNETAGSEGNG